MHAVVVEDQHVIGVTTSYGVHIKAQTSGGIAIQTEGTAPSVFGGTLNAITGFQQNGTAASGHVLRGNGTVFVDSAIQASDIPALATITLKKGSGVGNYTTSSKGYTMVDGTNLTYTVTIPVGWKLKVTTAGSCSNADGTTTTSLAIADGGVVLQEVFSVPPANNLASAYALEWVINGDG